ncbi:relaxase/mobilization nuclease domain-containing protein [Salipiger mangrovisoli]|uniref:Relaxase/mobilization nuclease domain-containing protein n=1 Tax=Salipiger mangrovisoli TaxID=2865933 RepID=A0ABR9X8C0_9RHOB|nr:relaxase/mobilization nuclease domain-containing protein [Salipiger mangrovisoli]MBE9639850.1 relaxase/mobilization nuclease domain-containing protein [Salipiger mangrovisoli]
MSEFKPELGFEDCWSQPRSARTLKSPGGAQVGKASGRTALGDKSGAEVARGRRGEADKAQAISGSDKARLARVVKGAPEVMVKVSKPARVDKHGNPIKVSRGTEALRVSEHLAYISRNGKIEIENDRGETFNGSREVASVFREWLEKHDDARAVGYASDRTRITTSIMFSMPGSVNAEAVKDAVRVLAEQEFQGRHDYVMALHTDTHHPHVHLTLRTVGDDGVKLRFGKPDLQHLRDTFAEKLRQRGIEAESTPRHARGATRRGEATPVYKIRQRGGKPLVDARKTRELKRDLEDNGGRLPQKPWDDALVARRSRVMTTYGNAVRILSQSQDPEDRQLAEATRKFSARLTDVTTQRGQMALTLDIESRGRGAGRRKGAEAYRSQERDQERGVEARGKRKDRGPER